MGLAAMGIFAVGDTQELAWLVLVLTRLLPGARRKGHRGAADCGRIPSRGTNDGSDATPGHWLELRLAPQGTFCRGSSK